MVVFLRSLCNRYRSANGAATVRLLLIVILMYGTLLLPMSASAANQLTVRSATVSSSAGAAPGVSYAMSFKIATATTMKGIRFKVCDSPLYNTTCTAPAGGGITWGTAVSLQKDNGTTFTQLYTQAAAGVATDQFFGNATGNAVVLNDVITFTVTGNTNPTTANKQYYLRIIVCGTASSGTAATCNEGTNDTDDGSVAMATTASMSVTATVQENLVFCAGITTNADCTTVGSASVPLNAGNAACPILSTTYTCTATSQLTAYTNASSGYAIAYNGTTLTAPAGTITAAPAGGAASATNTQQFGLKIARASGATATLNGTYSGTNIAFNSGDSLASIATPLDTETFTVTYNANINNLAKPGAYTSTLNYICTGTF